MKKIVILFLTLITLTPLFAGSGGISPAPSNPHGIRGVMNFTVNFRYLPTAAEVADLTTELEEANNLLCDITDGQLVMGHVRITTGTVNEDAADIWIPIFSSRSWSSVDALDVAGKHIMLYRDDIDGRTIAHELGHLALGILDEYAENCRPGGCGIGECIQGSEDPNNTNIMDNYYLMSDFSELCTPTNHDQVKGDGGACNTPTSCDEPDCDDARYCKGFNASTGGYESTSQELWYNESGWESMQRVMNDKYGINIAIPATVTAAQPDFCDYYLDIDNEVESSSLATLVIDISGSMSIKDAPIPGVDGESTRLQYAKKSGEIFVNLNRARGDLNLGVVSFNENATREHPMEILDNGNAGGFIGDINGLSAGGFTAIGNGLLEARFMMEGAEGENPTIFLLSDGESNRGIDPEDAADLLQAQGYRVFTIPVGNGADRTTLAGIAMNTGGEMIDAPTGDHLLPAYAEMAAKHRGNALILPRTQYAICASNGESCGGEAQSPTVQYDFPVEKNAEDLIVVLTNRNPLIQDWQPRFILKNNDTGMQISEKDKQFIDDDPFYRIIRFPAPDPGNWSIEVGSFSTGPANYGHILAYTENPQPDLFADCYPRIVPKGEKVFIEAKASYVAPLRDIKVTYSGHVLRPDGAIIPINFESEEVFGRNTATFDQMLGRGIYEVTVEATVADDTPFIAGESIHPGDPTPPLDVFGFTRQTTTSFFYEGEEFINCEDTQSGCCCEEDCDNDGIPNNQENEQFQDLDGDGIPNCLDQDSDGDDIPDAEEGDKDDNQNGIPDYLDPLVDCTIDIKFNAQVEQAPCNIAEGVIMLNPDGGSGAYEFDWSHDPDLRDEKASGLPAGFYMVCIRDLQFDCTFCEVIEVKSDCQDLPGINCANAIPLTFGQPVSGNLSQYNDRWSSYGCGEGKENGKEMLFKVILDQPGSLDLNLQNNSGGNSNFSIYLLDGCNAENCLELTQKTDLPAGTYYIAIEDTNNGGGTFELTAESSASLPLTWLNVSGEVVTNGNKISWKIADQLNISHYEIQRQSSDNQSFATIGKVHAKDAIEDYQFLDKQPTKQSLYRIKAIEISGQVSLSNVVVLQRNNDAPNALSIVPVPANQQVSLGFSSLIPQEIVINVTDITGKLVLVKQLETTAGQQEVELDVNRLNDGVYIVQLRKANGEVLTKRMVIQR